MHLIFDLDGTLFQARDSTLFAATAVFKELGILGMDEHQITKNIGRPMDEFLKNIFPENIVPDDVREKFRAYEHQAIRQQGKLFPGIADVLRELFDAGNILSICSNGSIEYINLVLNTTGIRDYFRGIYTAKHHISKAAFVAELLKPGEKAVFIGDSYDDIEAGVLNHIPSIAALYGYGDKARLGDATVYAQVPEDIIAYVNQIDIFKQIRERLNVQGGRIIGISGVDTSGKTVFTENFARFLSAVGHKCAVIHLDDFHNPMEVRRRGADEISAYYQNAFNYPQLIEELLMPLRENGQISKNILCLNVDTDKYENQRDFKIDDDTIVLIEGVLLFRPPISEYLNSRIFLHIEFDEVINRAEERDVPKYGEGFLQKYICKYIPIQKRYLKEFVPEKNCDIFIDNNDYRYPVIS